MEWLIKRILRSADVRVGRDIHVHDKSMYHDVLAKGTLGFGESYMQGKWDAPHLDVLITKFLERGSERNKLLGPGIQLVRNAKALAMNLQDRKHAPLLYQTHYNAGNHLFESFLDPNMIYTCAYWQNTDDLEQAQLDKIRIVGEKLQLKPGEKVLDIGCGWGGTARILSDMFDVDVTGVADTPNQIAYANEHNAGERVRFIQSDYRDITPETHGRFDKMYNIGFLEAVGPKNFRSFMEQADSLLEDDGLFFIHTIGGFPPDQGSDAWIDRYIFPNGVIPQEHQVMSAANGVFERKDKESFGQYYDRTLMAWNENFNKNWPTIEHHFDDPETFKRMMDFYHLSCAATFRSGKTDLWQMVFAKPGRHKDYKIYRLPKE